MIGVLLELQTFSNCPGSEVNMQAWVLWISLDCTQALPTWKFSQLSCGEGNWYEARARARARARVWDGLIC